MENVFSVIIIIYIMAGTIVGHTIFGRQKTRVNKPINNNRYNYNYTTIIPVCGFCVLREKRHDARSSF